MPKRSHRPPFRTRKGQNQCPGSTEDRFVLEGWQVLEEKVGANYKNRYVWSPSYIDALVTQDRDTDANGTLDERLFAQHDANFNVTAITNTSGTVQERYTPDPFGVVTFRDASGSTISASAKDRVFLHQGGQADILGHYDFRNRILSPTLGRWLTNDPLGFEAGDNNFYRYVANGPGNGLDPSGLADINNWIPIWKLLYHFYQSYYVKGTKPDDYDSAQVKTDDCRRTKNIIADQIFLERECIRKINEMATNWQSAWLGQDVLAGDVFGTMLGGVAAIRGIPYAGPIFIVESAVDAALTAYILIKISYAASAAKERYCDCDNIKDFKNAVN